MKKNANLYTAILVFIALIVATGSMLQSNYELSPWAYQCADCDFKDKTESSISDDYDELFLEEGQIISAIYIKAGDACYAPDGTCYNIVEGGVGFNFVKVERLGSGPDCQGISHLEVCYDPNPPTDTPTPTEEDPTETPTITPTATDTPTPTWTNTPDPSHTPTESPTPAPTDTATPLPTPTRTPCYPMTCGSG